MVNTEQKNISHRHNFAKRRCDLRTCTKLLSVVLIHEQKCKERSRSGFATTKGPLSNAPPTCTTKTDEIVEAEIVSWQSLLDIPVSVEGAYIPTEQYNKHFKSLKAPVPNICCATLPSPLVSDFPDNSSVATHHVKPQEPPSNFTLHVPKLLSLSKSSNFQNLCNNCKSRTLKQT